MATTDRSRPEPVMLRGTLFTLRRRCGKPNCHCATGPAHETPALAYPQAGRTKTVTLSADDVEEVRAALERYNTARADARRQRRRRAVRPASPSRPAPPNPMSAARTATSPDAAAFGESRACFEEIVGWLEGTDAGSLTHGELEDDLDRRGRQLLLRLLQDHLDLRARQEQRTDVVDHDGVRHGSVEAGHHRTLGHHIRRGDRRTPRLSAPGIGEPAPRRRSH